MFQVVVIHDSNMSNNLPRCNLVEFLQVLVDSSGAERVDQLGNGFIKLRVISIRDILLCNSLVLRSSGSYQLTLTAAVS